MDLIGISDLICLLPMLHKYPSAFIFPLAHSSLYFPVSGFGFFIAIFSHLLGKVLEEMKLFGGSASSPALRGLPRNVLGQGGPRGAPALAPPRAQPRLITMEMTLCQTQPRFGSRFVALCSCTPEFAPCFKARAGKLLFWVPKYRFSHPLLLCCRSLVLPGRHCSL